MTERCNHLREIKALQRSGVDQEIRHLSMLFLALALQDLLPRRKTRTPFPASKKEYEDLPKSLKHPSWNRKYPAYHLMLQDRLFTAKSNPLGPPDIAMHDLARIRV